MADVFISYAREDEPTARRLAHVLAARGWTVWWDRKLVPGTEFDRKIEQEVRAAKAVVVLWSEHSVPSRWVKSEATVAADRGVMIPVVLDSSLPPMQFATIQSVYLAGWDGREDDDAVEGLVTAVTEMAGSPRGPLAPPVPPPPQASGPKPAPAPDPGRDPEPAPDPKPADRRRRVAAAVAAALVLVAVVGAAAAVANRNGSTTPPPTSSSTTTSSTSSTTTTTTTTTTVALPAGAVLVSGVRGEDVKDLQELLRDRGFDPGSIDGRFGGNTLRALRAFEQANADQPGVNQDGGIQVASAEWKLLESLPTTVPTTKLPATTTTLPAICNGYHVQAGAAALDQAGEPDKTGGV